MNIRFEPVRLIRSKVILAREVNMPPFGVDISGKLGHKGVKITHDQICH